MNIEINLLRHAIALGKFEHFSNAAESLHISQPALSRSIKKLEHKLGQPLFTRGTKTIEPTDFGRLFLERAKSLLTTMDNFVDEMVESGQETYGKLLFGCGPYPAETVVASAMASFSMQNPKVEQVVRIESIEKLLPDMLANNGLECIVAELSAINLLPGLEITSMGSHRLVFVVRTGHSLAGAYPSLQQILQYPFVVPARLPPRVYGPLHSVWKMNPPEQRPAFPAIECASLSVIKRIVTSSDAVACLQLSAIASELESGELIILRSEPWLHLNYGFVQRKGIALSKYAIEFKRMLLQEESVIAKQEKRLIKQYLSK